MRCQKALVAACLLPLLTACSIRPGRVADLLDCGRASVGVGPGLCANLRLGDLFAPALGLGSRTYRVGVENRNVYGCWQDTELAFPALPVAYGKLFCPSPRWLAYSYARGGIKGPASRIEPWSAAVARALGGAKWYDRPAVRSATDIEAGATILVVSARVGVNPIEIADFVGGFFGADLADDDPDHAKPQKGPPTGKESAAGNVVGP